LGYKASGTQFTLYQGLEIYRARGVHAIVPKAKDALRLLIITKAIITSIALVTSLVLNNLVL